MKKNDDEISYSLDSLWKSIIRPPKQNYTIKDLGLKEFNVYAVFILLFKLIVLKLIIHMNQMKEMMIIFLPIF